MSNPIKAKCVEPCWYMHPDEPAGTPRRKLLVGDIVDISPDDPRLTGKGFVRDGKEGLPSHICFERVAAEPKSKPEPKGKGA